MDPVGDTRSSLPVRLGHRLASDLGRLFGLQGGSGGELLDGLGRLLVDHTGVWGAVQTVDLLREDRPLGLRGCSGGRVVTRVLGHEGGRDTLYLERGHLLLD